MKQMIAVAILALSFSSTLFARMPDGEKPAMMADCAAMMKQHDMMQKHMSDMDAKLQTLVAEMNKATGSAKVDKTAAVVTEMVMQRSMMQKQMMEMHPKMMGHMKAHMGNGKGMAGSMSDCPMMKGSEKTSAKPTSEHKH